METEAHCRAKDKFLEALLGQVVVLHFESERLLGYGLSITQGNQIIISENRGSPATGCQSQGGHS